MNRILIVSACARRAAFLRKGLRADGYVTTLLADHAATAGAARTARPDLVVLDVEPPIAASVPLLGQLRSLHLPVIVLSSSRGSEDVVAALEGGAADYLARPFRFDELLARVRLRLRLRADAVLRGDGVLLDLRSRRAHVDGRPVDLTAREFTLLALLLRSRHAVLTRDEMLADAWGPEFDVSSNVVEACVRSLRTKIGFERIDTVRGVGYRCN